MLCKVLIRATFVNVYSNLYWYIKSYGVKVEYLHIKDSFITETKTKYILLEFIGYSQILFFFYLDVYLHHRFLRFELLLTLNYPLLAKDTKLIKYRNVSTKYKNHALLQGQNHKESICNLRKIINESACT